MKHIILTGLLLVTLHAKSMSSSRSTNQIEVNQMDQGNDIPAFKYYEFKKEHKDILSDFASGNDIQLLYFNKKDAFDKGCMLPKSQTFKQIKVDGNENDNNGLNKKGNLTNSFKQSKQETSNSFIVDIHILLLALFYLTVVFI
ncbi:hypothetical protein K502DRAFT_132951 [Neoconidiobolus thromboides FSU 785]|nr:hypothetical protein K502DRAFT_132951 [Neoconidiobolus thromboides FSU 785]